MDIKMSVENGDKRNNKQVQCENECVKYYLNVDQILMAFPLVKTSNVFQPISLKGIISQRKESIFFFICEVSKIQV